MKHGVGNIRIWGCFSIKRKKQLICMKEGMTGAMHGETVCKNLLPSVKTLRMKHGWVFQHDSDPKHLIQETECLRKKHFKVLELSSLSLDLNSIENLWSELKVYVALQQPLKSAQLLRRSAWMNGPNSSSSEYLVKIYRKHFT